MKMSSITIEKITKQIPKAELHVSLSSEDAPSNFFACIIGVLQEVKEKLGFYPQLEFFVEIDRKNIKYSLAIVNVSSTKSIKFDFSIKVGSIEEFHKVEEQLYEFLNIIRIQSKLGKKTAEIISELKEIIEKKRGRKAEEIYVEVSGRENYSLLIETLKEFLS